MYKTFYVIRVSDISSYRSHSRHCLLIRSPVDERQGELILYLK